MTQITLLGIDLGKSKAVKLLLDYRDRLFERESILASLSEQEKEMG